MNIAPLLQKLSDSDYEKLLVNARALTAQRFGKTIQLYAPLYLSNECVDTCTYCGFSFINKIPRKTLTPDEVISEAQFLTQEGFRHILLVAGEHPIHVSSDYLEDVIQRLKSPQPPFDKEGISSLAIEVAPFKEPVYKRLVEAGLDGVVIYQETYDFQCYANVHIAGPKMNYENRIAAPEEAAKAGIRFLGMGILLGLADWRTEAVQLVEHVRRLRKKYWQTDIQISLPRLRDCASDFEPPYPVSDRDFIQLIAALRIALPETGIILSTRESPALRDQLIGLGITHMSAGSRTEPGGYLHPEESLKQFEINDHRSVPDVVKSIENKGYEAVWKDL